MNAPSAPRKTVVLVLLVCLIAGTLLASVPPPTSDEGEGSVEVSVKLPRDYPRLVIVTILATLAVATIPSANVSLVVAASIATVEQLFPTSESPKELDQPTEPHSILGGPAPSSSSGLTPEPGDLSNQAPTPGSPGLFSSNAVRGYILNTALTQKDSDGQTVEAPNLVDFLNLNDFSYFARVNIDLPSDAFYEPQDMALTNNGSQLVVVSKGADPAFFPDRNPPSHLTIVDTATAEVVKRINLASTDWPVSLVLSPDGRLAYVSCPQKTSTSIDGADIVVVDLQTDAIVNRLPLPYAGGTGSGETVITPDGALLLVLTGLQFIGPTSRPGIAVIDTRTMTVSTTIGGIAHFEDAQSLGSATQLAISPNGTTVYAADAPTPQGPDDFSTFGIAVVDVTTATVTKLVPIPGVKNHGIDDIQVSSDGRYITHTDGVSGLISVLDAVSLEVLYQKDGGDAVLTNILEGP